MKILPVSALSSWIRCPKQFYLSYVIQEKTPLNDAMVLGLIKHKLHELMSQQEEQIIKTLRPKENPQEIFTQQFNQLLTKSIKTYSNSLRTVQVSLMTAFQKSQNIIHFEATERATRLQPYLEQGLTGEELWEAITPKIKTEYSIKSEKLGIKGRIDRLELYGDKIIPVELKSGTMPQTGAWEEHTIQATSYAAMLEELFNTKVPEAIVQYVDHNQRRLIKINPFHHEQIKETINKAQDCIKTQEIPNGCGKEHCKACKDTRLS